VRITDSLCGLTVIPDEMLGDVGDTEEMTTRQALARLFRCDPACIGDTETNHQVLAEMSLSWTLS
jgi:hypothetical protein